MSISHGRHTRIGGIGLDVIAEETLKRHNRAFSEQEGRVKELDSGGEYQWRKDGEDHLFNPQTIHTLQMASVPMTINCTRNSLSLFRVKMRSI